VQQRASYRDDGAFLLRLENAVSKDERQPEAWRRETTDMIRALALRLLEVETQAPATASKKR
jgi:hypothetical protein